MIDLAQGDDALQENQVVLLRPQVLGPILDRRPLQTQAGGGADERVRVAEQRPEGRQRRRQVAADERLAGAPPHEGVVVLEGHGQGRLGLAVVVDADQVDGLGADLSVPVQDQLHQAVHVQRPAVHLQEHHRLDALRGGPPRVADHGEQLLRQVDLLVRDPLVQRRPAPGGLRLRPGQQPFGGRLVPFLLVAAVVDDAVDAALRVPTAHREIDRAVRGDADVRHVHRGAGAEFFEIQFIGRPVWFETRGVDNAERPVGHEVGALVPGREGGVFVELQADRRAAADVVNGRQAVDVVRRRVGRAGAPAEVGAGRAVADAHRPIPRQALVPLHVAVEGEQLAVETEGGVEDVTEAAGHQRRVPAVGVEPPDAAARRQDVRAVAVGVVEPRQQRVLRRAGLVLVRPHLAVRPAPERRIRRQIAHVRPRVVAVDDVEGVVGAVEDGVRPVFAHAADLAAARRLGLAVGKQQRRLVDLVLALRVAAAVEAGAAGAVADQQQGVADPAHALTILDDAAIRPDVLQHAVLVGVGAEQDRPVFLRDEQPALGVEGHVDQREDVLGVGVLRGHFDMEALWRGEARVAGVMRRGFSFAPKGPGDKAAAHARPNSDGESLRNMGCSKRAALASRAASAPGG